jgi:hypothetical protein
MSSKGQNSSPVSFIAEEAEEEEEEEEKAQRAVGTSLPVKWA